MKQIGVLVAVLLVIILFIGCTSNVPATPAPQPRATGPEITRVAEIALPSSIAPQEALTIPGNVIRVNTTDHEFFFLDPVKNYHVGDNITVHGTTILSAGNPLLIEVVSSSFGPLPKSSRQAFTGVSGIATVKEGTPGGPNTWTFSFPTDGFTEDTYIVTVSGITIDVRDSTTFLLEPRI